MANESGNVPMPPPGAAVVKKSHTGLIVGAVVVLGLLWMMNRGGGSGGGAGGNPILGKWSLVNAEDASYCPTTQEFTASKSKWTQDGETREMKPIYDVKLAEGRVTVGYGTSYIGNWTVNGPDDLTLGQVGPPPYGVPSFCKYHRM